MSEIMFGQPPAQEEAVITSREVRAAMRELTRYKSGKAMLEKRVVASEEWFRLRHWDQMEMTTGDQSVKLQTRSAWLFHAINNAHSDAMAAYPAPNILPREKNDRAEAQMLTKIIPVVLQHNKYKSTYSQKSWRKLRTGTGVTGVFWDPKKLNGLGDISIRSVDVLHLFWEPGVSDIQESRYFFNVDMVDRDTLRMRYPDLPSKAVKGTTFVLSEYMADDPQGQEKRVPVIDWYYKREVNGKQVLHYCKFVGDTVLYASENEPELRETGYYAHGLYPFVFDPLYPVEGSPCGFGLVDLEKNPQEQIDLLNSAIVTNAMTGAQPRYFSRKGSGLNEEEYLDVTKPIVHTETTDENALRPIDTKALPAIYVNVLNGKIEELKQTSGNTDVASGASTSGATSFVQMKTILETSGKNMKASNEASYRAYKEEVELVIELIRQFYDAPRQFRILGDRGVEEFVEYTNAGLQMQPQGNEFGQDMGMRLPVFDVEVHAEQESEYTKLAQNETAIQMQGLGVFNPAMADQSLMMLEMMDFRGREELMQKVQQMGTMFKLLQYFQQLSLQLASVYEPPLVDKIMQQIGQSMPLGAQKGISQGLPIDIEGAKETKNQTGANMSKNLTSAEKSGMTRGAKVEKVTDQATKPE